MCSYFSLSAWAPCCFSSCCRRSRVKITLPFRRQRLLVLDGYGWGMHGRKEGRKEGGGLEPPPTHQEGCVCCHLLLLSLPSASSSSFTFRPLLCCVIFSGVTLCSFDHYHFHIQLHRHRTPAHPCRESNYTLNP